MKTKTSARDIKLAILEAKRRYLIGAQEFRVRHLKVQRSRESADKRLRKRIKI